MEPLSWQRGLDCTMYEKKVRDMGLFKLKKKPNGLPNGSYREDGP